MNRDGQHADLPDDLADQRRPPDAEAVTLAKPLALDFVFIQTSPQREQFVAADRSLGAEIADRLGRRLLVGKSAPSKESAVRRSS